MLRSTRRRAAAVVLSAASVLAMTGCSALGGLVGGVEPVRDAETGAIVEAARADAFALRVGDCLDMSSQSIAEEEAVEFQSMPTVPCGDAHDSEIYASHQLPDGEYPGDEAVAATADQLCYEGFEPFVGLAYEDSVLDISAFYPTADSWELLDDREVQCIIFDPSALVTGTLEGAAR